MSNSFQPLQLGMTAFMAANRIDFVVDGPDTDAERVSAFYDNPDKKMKLSGKGLKITKVATDDDGEPTQLHIKWGRKTIKLGRRQNASGPVSFYRSLETTNEANAPKSASEIMAKLDVFTK